MARNVQEHVSDLLPLRARDQLAHCDPSVANLDAFRGQDAATSWQDVVAVRKEIIISVPAVAELHYSPSEHSELQVEWRLVFFNLGVFQLFAFADEPCGSEGE